MRASRRTGVIHARPRAGHAAAASQTAARWQARRLLSAPHRLGFFVGALMLVLSALWWSVVLVLRHGPGWVLPWAVSPGLAHSLWFVFGFMPPFFSGFLFTAAPRWLGRPPVPARVLLAPLLASLAGWGVFVAGVHQAPALAAIGLAAVSWGWLGVTRRLVALLRASDAAERLHAGIVTGACGIGVLTMAAAAAALMAGREDVARAAVQSGLWGFIAPVFLTVAHRIVPFFGAAALPRVDRWWPTWLLWTLLALCTLQLSFALAAPWWWPGPPAWRLAQIGVDALSALLLLGLALRWARVQNLRVRLITMLYAGFLWLGLSFVLSAASRAWLLWGDGTRSFGQAPLHALAMGFFGTTLLAMATRVSSGQGGRTLAADALVWRLFLVLQAAVALRVTAALWPVAEPALLMAAALAWLVAMGGWSLRYGRWFGRPRADGRPG